LVLTEGEITWDVKNNRFLNPDNNSLPPALDNVFKNEPFYVDLRQSKSYEDLSLDNPIFKKEILKLAAKLHNKPPNELASEEVTAHRKWMLVRNVVMSILSLLLITSIGLAIVYNKQREKADQKTVQAEKEKREKEKSLEELKEFVSKGIGKEYEGGIIFSVDAERENGFIAA